MYNKYARAGPIGSPDNVHNLSCGGAARVIT